MNTPYPDTWPKANPKAPLSAVSRITEAQKLALYNRETTSKAVALALNVGATYISTLFPGKVISMTASTPKKKALLDVRREYRALQAKRVLDGHLTIQKAADELRISYRSMARAVEAIRPPAKLLVIRMVPIPAPRVSKGE